MPSPRTLLIITYYWPPAGGVEVQRIVKFCKYLPDMGYEPVVLTVEGGTASASDPELAKEIAHISTVRRAASWEPHRLYQALGGRSSGTEASSRMLPALADFFRLNLFIPDARIGWYPRAVTEGSSLIQEMKPDLILSTAPPYTVHLVAKTLARRHRIPWVADFRDPWVENYAYNTQFRFPWVRWMQERLERQVLDTADHVVVATQGQEALQSAKARDGNARFTTIPNGHDFGKIPDIPPSRTFQLSYFGSLSAQRVPVALFDTLAALIREIPGFSEDFCFRFAGRISPEAAALIRERLPESQCRFLPMLPHQEYRKLLWEQQVLLILVDQVPHNSLILPAKCFEMVTTGNPLIACGPVGGETERFLREHDCGTLADYQDTDLMRRTVLELYQKWKEERLHQGTRDVESLHRRQRTKELARILDNVISCHTPASEPTQTQCN